MSPVDWREESYCMKSLIHKLYNRSQSNNFTDVTFKLPDGSVVAAHKLILAVASPFFEAQFYGLLATDDSIVVVENVESTSFRRVLEFIYKSGDIEWTMDNMEYWNLLQAAHMYLVPGLINLCNSKLSSFLNTITDNRELVEHVNRASALYIYEGILSSGLLEIKSRLNTIIKTPVWNLLDENVVLEILDDDKLKVTEGSLFQGMIDWCKHNTDDTQAAMQLFQTKFASKVRVKNMTKETFLSTIGSSDFIPPNLFKAWTFEILEGSGQKLNATRFALNPLKIQQTVIERNNFIEPVGGLANRMLLEAPPLNDGGNPVPLDREDPVLWNVKDEYDDVNITIRIFQKVPDSQTARSNFRILLETVHKAKVNMNKSAIKERVSVKMVAKKQDGTVVKKLFKPIEDSNKEGTSHRSNIFLLSKNKEERQHWHVMEIVVIIDRRPTCHIKGISGEEFAKTVCCGQTQNYLNKAVSVHYNVDQSIQTAVEKIAKELKMSFSTTQPPSQWLYIFTKGYVSNLRSRRAMPNDYWTAETVEDYMRCKVINFPIGVQNEAMRRDAFRTWIISRKIADDKEKDKKNVFVCTYNPDLQEVKFLKTHSLPVETKVETLGLLEHISLGSVKVDDKFFHEVTLGVPVTLGVKIYIRRVFPIQNERDERSQRVLVTEAVPGSTLTHIDDCHVLVVQTKKTQAQAPDFDKFLLMKIREIRVTCIRTSKDRGSVAGPSETPPSVMLLADPTYKKSDIIARLSQQLGKPRNMVEIFKCYSGKTIKDRCAEHHIQDDESFDSIFQYCEDEKKLFYRELLAPSDALTPLSPHHQSAQLPSLAAAGRPSTSGDGHHLHSHHLQEHAQQHQETLSILDLSTQSLEEGTTDSVFVFPPPRAISPWQEQYAVLDGLETDMDTA